MKFKTAYGTRERVTLNCPEPTRTEQHHKDQVEINNILAKYERTGVIDHRNKYEGQYNDLAAYDYQENMFKIAAANTMFEELPSGLRARFNNQPAQFLEFVQNPRNREEMIELGLATRREFDVQKPPARRAGDSLPPEGAGKETKPDGE